MADLFDRFLYRTYTGGVFATFRPLDFYVHHGRINNVQKVMEHVAPKQIGECSVFLVGVKYSRQNIFLAPGFPDG
jgi:hypothetical protein